MGKPISKTRHKGIRAGLDNAVRQAEERNLHDLFVVDADCHQMEPFAELAKFIDSPYKEVFLSGDKEDDPLLSGRDEGLLNNKSTVKQVHYGPGRRKRSEITYPEPQSPDEIIQILTQRMQDIGIKVSVIFPTTLLSVATDPRHDFEVGVMNAYMDFMLEHFLGKYPEILSPVCVPVNSPDKAAELIHRIGPEKGVIGVMIPSMTPTLAGDDSWDPIYEAAQEEDLPICMHSNNYVGGFFGGFQKFIGVHALSRPVTMAIQVTSIVLNGVPERFPKLKFLFIEGGVTWIPWIMQRLDAVYLMRREEAPLLTKKPSEYIKDFYFTSQPLEFTEMSDLNYSFKKFDAENHLLFASDYPHWDFDLPSSIYDLPFLTETAKRKILGQNAAKFFGIPEMAT